MIGFDSYLHSNPLYVEKIGSILHTTRSLFHLIASISTYEEVGSIPNAIRTLKLLPSDFSGGFFCADCTPSPHSPVLLRSTRSTNATRLKFSLFRNSTRLYTILHHSTNTLYDLYVVYLYSTIGIVEWRYHYNKSLKHSDVVFVELICPILRHPLAGGV